MTLKSLNFTLLVANLDSEMLSELADELNKKRLMAPEFFAHTPMVVNITKKLLNIDFSQLQLTVEAEGFFLTGITGKISEQQKQQANAQSIPVLHSSQRELVKAMPIEEALESDLIADIVKEETDIITASPSFPACDIKTKVHIGRVRSGQQIYAKECDLVISGDVGAGAEVIADGNIHIYGSLRGKALAGAMGNTNASIFCQTLQPELVSIAGIYKLSDALPGDKWSTACSISLKDQDMVFLSLNQI